MRRRQVLASGAALLSVPLAGCGHPPVVHDGSRYRVAVDSRTAPKATYRYDLTEVAASLEAFADQVREQYLFTRSGLSDGFRSVVERIRQHEGLGVDDSYGTWLLEYEGSEYITYAEW